MHTDTSTPAHSSRAAAGDPPTCCFHEPRIAVMILTAGSSPPLHWAMSAAPPRAHSDLPHFPSKKTRHILTLKHTPICRLRYTTVSTHRPPCTHKHLLTCSRHDAPSLPCTTASTSVCPSHKSYHTNLWPAAAPASHFATPLSLHTQVLIVISNITVMHAYTGGRGSSVTTAVSNSPQGTSAPSSY